MPIPIALAIAAATSAYKVYKGHEQKEEAAELAKRDTTPLAFKEALGMARQQAAAGLPGEGQQLNQLDAGQNNVLAAGARAGTSSNSILGLLSSADASRNLALGNLNTRADAFHQSQSQHLERLLSEQSKYQLGDQREFDLNKAALNQAGDTNLYNGGNGLAQVAAYALAKGSKSKDDEDSADDAGSLSTSTGAENSLRRHKYGVPYNSDYLRIQGFD